MNFAPAYKNKKRGVVSVVSEKRLLAAILVGLMMFSLIGCQTKETSKFSNPTVGQSDFEFGGHTWVVLDVQDNRALLLTKDIIENVPYNVKYKKVTWAECTLREYLNGEFFDTTFTDEEKTRILEVNNSNPDSEWFGTEGGEDTLDKVFLLSNEEVVKYFGDSGDLLNPPGQLNATMNDADYVLDDEYSEARLAEYDGAYVWWWLRSPGHSRSTASAVTHRGKIHMGGYFVQEKFGLRPAIWINLD